MKPYKFKKLIFNDGILNNSVDATYIIHLEDNGRYEHIQKQLLEYHPTNLVYILFNKGYKKSIKKSFIDNPPQDLVDCFLKVFKHANKKNYNNILILEDDFIFSEKIKETKHINNINYIINKLNNQNFIYYLGCIPFYMFPYDYYNYILFKSSIGTHSVIYSKKNRIQTLEIDQQKIDDWDSFNWNNKRLTYYIPLCYQIFTNTDNSNYWGYKDNKLINKIRVKLLKKFLKICYLDKYVEPGTTFFYIIAKFSFSFILILILLLFILYYYHKNIVK